MTGKTSINGALAFAEPYFLDVLSKIRHPLYSEKGVEELRRLITPAELARNMIVDKVVKDHIQFNFLNNPMGYFVEGAVATFATDFYNATIYPLLVSTEVVQEVSHQLVVENITYKMGNHPCHRFAFIDGTLVAGVEPGFLAEANQGTFTKDFVKAALRELSTRVSDPDLTGSNLFRKFVKLSIAS